MKRFMKGCAITALVLIVLGFILGAIGGNIRGRTAIQDVVEAITGGRVKLQLGPENWNAVGEAIMDQLAEEGYYDINDAVLFEDRYEIMEGDISRYTLEGNIGSLNVEIGGCTLYLEESKDSVFSLEAENTRKLQAYIENGTLYIKALRNGQIWNEPGSCKITLYVPEVYMKEKADIAVGAGAIEMENLNAADVYLEVGAGSVEAGRLQADSLDVNVGAGEVSIYEMQVRRLAGEVGVGYGYLKGDVTENADISCAMGSVDLFLGGAQPDYNYAVECGMGSVEIGSESYSGLAREQYVNNQAPRNINVDCAMGSVSIYFDR